MINLNIVMPVELITLINIVKRAKIYLNFVDLTALEETIEETIEEFYMKIKKDY